MGGQRPEEAETRSGRWFDPELVQAAKSLAKDGPLWIRLESQELITEVMSHEPLEGRLTADEQTIDNICLVFADVFDALSAKRPYRDALPLEKVFSIMREEAPHALDWPCLAALMEAKPY